MQYELYVHCMAIRFQEAYFMIFVTAILDFGGHLGFVS